jgi:hypothetical protein
MLPHHSCEGDAHWGGISDPGSAYSVTKGACDHLIDKILQRSEPGPGACNGCVRCAL